MTFADRLFGSIERNSSFLCAGFDPVIDRFPPFILEQAAAKSSNNEDLIYHALLSFFEASLHALKDRAACVKPNLAFYEQYGIGGIRAFASICTVAREVALPVIADAKRGDIGSTAEAYSSAFLTGTKVSGRAIASFDADAVTVNPFLGFDTLEVFLKAAEASGKGVFILVRTSNPGSKDLQTVDDVEGRSISDRLAEYVGEKAPMLEGKCGYSGVGAVLGATSPAVAVELRRKMPSSFILIPGYGAQGAGAADAVAGFSEKKHGAIINASRALLGKFENGVNDRESLMDAIRKRADDMNTDIAKALAARG